jgi:hypothetical protein
MKINFFSKLATIVDCKVEFVKIAVDRIDSMARMTADYVN